MKSESNRPKPDTDAHLAEGEALRVAPAGESVGDCIGRYKLLKVLGEGGMGSVWMAQQSEPVKRRVALKIIKLGMDTKQVVARFEVERQALALMDHPHIAKVLDAGATQSGRSYFVMELVHGVPITNYCDDSRLDLRQRLELFQLLCQAIQHAHHKGIIHRDVKPSNILVAEHAGQPYPKVIDFGIAKATRAQLTEETLYTRQGDCIGTLEYMAPEQASTGGLDIDTRADVYSLGVLLYELLTGSLPFVLDAPHQSAHGELLRRLCELEPEKPSGRFASLGADAVRIAGTRQSSVKGLKRQLAGDLDWIVMKALEKDRKRRYETANELGQDIQRFLGGEEVEAAPPSARYRLGKRFVRHRKSLLAVLVLALLLSAGTLGTAIGWWRSSLAGERLDLALNAKAHAILREAEQRAQAEAEEQLALAAEAEAKREAEHAAQAEASSKVRAEELEQVAAFQAQQLRSLDVAEMGLRMRQALLDLAGTQQPPSLKARVASLNFTNLALLTLRENLFEQTLAAIDEQFAGQPLVQAQMLQSSADTLVRLGLHALALEPQQRALEIRRRELGTAHPETLLSINNLGTLLEDQGEYAEAERYYREDLALSRSLLGELHPETLSSINNLGGLLFSQGKLEEAKPLILEALEGRRAQLGEAHPSTLNSMQMLAHFLRASGQLSEAEALFRAALAGLRALPGDHRDDTLYALGSLGGLLQDQGRLDEAESYLQEELSGSRETFGDRHPRTLTAINNVAGFFYAEGKLQEARALYGEALEGNRQVLGDEHPTTLTSICNMALSLKSLGELTEAEPFALRALESRRRVLGNEHPDTLVSIINTGVLYQEQARLALAEPLFWEAVEISGKLLGEGHPNTLTASSNLALLLHSQGRTREAESLYRQAFTGRSALFGLGHPDTQASIQNLEALLRHTERTLRSAGDEAALGVGLLELGEFLLLCQRFAEAEAALSEAFEMLLAELPEDDERPWLAENLLGAACAGQGRFGEAEALLVESATWLMEHGTASPDPLASALQGVIEFYAAWHASQPGKGHDATAAQWQSKLDDWNDKHSEASDE